MDFKYLKRGTKYTMSDPKDDEKMAAGVDDKGDSDKDVESYEVELRKMELGDLVSMLTSTLAVKYNLDLLNEDGFEDGLSCQVIKDIRPYNIQCSAAWWKEKNNECEFLDGRMFLVSCLCPDCSTKAKEEEEEGSSDSDSEGSSDSDSVCSSDGKIPCYDCCEEVLEDDTVYFREGGRGVCLECWADRYTCKKKECLDSRNCYCEDAYRMA